MFVFSLMLNLFGDFSLSNPKLIDLQNWNMKSTETCNLPIYGDTFLAISPCALISKCSRYEKIDCRLLPLSRRLLYSMDLYGNYMAEKHVSCPVPLKAQICNFQV